MRLMDELNTNSELLNDNVDYSINREVSSFFAKNESPNFKDVKLLIDKLIVETLDQFAIETGKRDVRTRISDFYKRIYSIKENSNFQIWMTKNEDGKELYGRVMSLLKSEQFPDPREYSPERDKRIVIDRGNLKQVDFDIRKKCIEDIINNDELDIVTSAHMQTLCDIIGDKTKNLIEMNLGRMDMNHAILMKVILQYLGYNIELKSLLTGNERVIASKIPLSYEKRNDKIFQNFELEEMGIPDGFSFEEWKMVQEYDESIEGLASIFSKFSVPQKENANIMGSESTVGKSTINRNIEELIEECKIGKYDDIRKHGSSPCYAIDDDVVLVHHKNSEDSKIFAEFFKSLSDEDKKNIFTVIDYKEIEGDDRCWELQARASGEHFRGDVEGQEQIKNELLNRYSMILGMPQEHIRDFFRAIMVLGSNKMEYDNSGNNVLYDKDKGFQIIDLDYCGKRIPNYKIDINNLLLPDNYQTMTLLLGTNRIPKVSQKSYGRKITQTDREQIRPIIQETLKKIILSVLELEYNGQKITYEGIKNCLEEYKEYGIELSIDEILNDKNKFITQEEIGKATINRNIEGIDIAKEKVSNIAEKIRYLNQDIEQE